MLSSFDHALCWYKSCSFFLLVPYLSKGTVLDKYGANLASADLPGQGHRLLDNQLQYTMKSMMRLGGVFADSEAVNFILDKVGDPYIIRYVHHVTSHPSARRAPHTIVPDLHAPYYPTGWQRANDRGATSPAEAFFEVKIYTLCISRYDHDQKATGPADHRARLVSQEYARKFKKNGFNKRF